MSRVIDDCELPLYRQSPVAGSEPLSLLRWYHLTSWQIAQ